MPNPVVKVVVEKLIDKRAIAGFIVGYCISECIEKDYALKPVLCTLACGAATLIGAKVTYKSAGLAYDTVVKPILQTYANSKKIGNGNLPPLP
jgi:hypothetical protein